MLKVQNHTLETKNPKWKEWWQIIHKGTKGQIHESMKLTCFDEHSYQIELQAYQIAFLDFKYEPPNFVSVEIRTSSKT